MVKKLTLFSIQQNKNQINMDVDESLYNHFQTLTLLQQKAIKDLMTFQMLSK